MKKPCLKVFVFISLGLLLNVNTSLGETGFVNRKEFGIQPSFSGDISMVLTYIGCYDAFTGRELDCAFTHKVIGIKEPSENIQNNGGHKHNYDTHPLIEPRDGRLGVAGGQFERINNLWIKGQTRNGEVVVIHPMPEASGKIVRETFITAPPHWMCVRNCFTYNSWKYEVTLDVGIGNLEGLGSSGDYHVVVRGGEDTHPEGTSGATITIEMLNEIAKKYKKLTGRKLSINDISLPKGSVFDVCNTYNPKDTCPAAPKGGHFEHRIGNDADINQADGGGVSLDCATLKKVINQIGKGGIPTLKCESGGRMHIDFD